MTELMNGSTRAIFERTENMRYFDDYGVPRYHAFTDEYVEWLEAKFDELRDQLRWRPVSEKPEKAGVYFVEARPYAGCDSTTITTAYFDGESFLWHDVVRWLPIPPASEGE